ncbi:3-alpha domain-containing protein [uncultured Shewanella sp.]
MSAIRLYFSKVFNAKGYESLLQCQGLAQSWKSRLYGSL